MSSPICCKILDLTSIYDKCNDKEQIDELTANVFDTLLSEGAQEWTLEAACAEHKNIPPAKFLPRPLVDAFQFLAKAFSLSTHAMSQAFGDNHLALLRNSSCIYDGKAPPHDP